MNGEIPPVGIRPYERILDKSDSNGKVQFSRALEVIYTGSRPGGWLKSRWYWGPIRRYRAKRAWSDMLTHGCGNIYMDGWLAAERFYDVGTSGRGPR